MRFVVQENIPRTLIPLYSFKVGYLFVLVRAKHKILLGKEFRNFKSRITSSYIQEERLPKANA